MQSEIQNLWVSIARAEILRSAENIGENRFWPGCVRRAGINKRNAPEAKELQSR